MTSDERIDYILGPSMIQLNQKLDHLLESQSKILEIIAKSSDSSNVDKLNLSIDNLDYQVKKCFGETSQQFENLKGKLQETLVFLQERLA